MAAIDHKTVLEIPLDFSFMSFPEITDIVEEEPREVNKKKPVKNQDGKYNSRCVRVNNNAIRDAKNCMASFEKIIDKPLEITWIDFSFNELVNIDPVFCDFPKLQILYLHGNQIEDLREVDKLGSLPNLTKLSLHGNPVDKIKNYRFYVLTKIPQLKNFDMSAVTKADRATASTGNWKCTAVKGKRKKKEAEVQA